MHSDLLPTAIPGCYIEPFLGSGAAFFHLRPRRAVLSDTNADLIEVYEVLREDYASVVRLLHEHHSRHLSVANWYYQVRDAIPYSSVERVARFIYLNRTCFNGIYRVNRSGRFNVPKGTKTKVILDDDDWEAWAGALRDAVLSVSDFEAVIDDARQGDYVFADPPYTVHHNTNAFVKYNEVLFSWDDQVRLAASVERARTRGVRILVTNANNEAISAMYGSAYNKHTVRRYSSISASKRSRRSFEELVITA